MVLVRKEEIDIQKLMDGDDDEWIKALPYIEPAAVNISRRRLGHCCSQFVDDVVMAAIEKLNQLLSEKVSQRCSSCGVKLPESFDFNICEACFGARRFSRPRRRGDANRSGGNKGRGPGKPKYGKDSRPPKGKPSKKRGKRPGAKKRGAKKSSPFTKG